MTQKQKKRLKQSGKISAYNRVIKDKRYTYLHLINKALVCSLVFCVIYFVISINDISIKGMVLSDLKSRVKQLQSQNETIEQKVTALQSYENISRRAEELKMVKVDKIDYISVSGEAVARK